MHKRRVSWMAALLAVAVAALAAGGCGGGDDPDEGSEGAVAEITFWGRAANEAINQRLVDEYNKTHETKVAFTVFPDDQFVPKVGTASASGDVPDVLAVDAVYMPQFIESGLMLDVSDRAKALPFFDELSPAQMRVATADDRVYAVPRDVATSSLFWNKELFERAGLDPEQPPTSWAEIEEYSRKITELGDGVNGFYFPGNASGPNAFTLLPLIWASGGEVLTEEGAPTFDTPAMREALSLYQRLWNDGQVPKSAKTDAGENWLTGFTAGKVGIQPLGSFAIGALRSENPDLEFGVAPLPGQSGGESSFAGGDVIGIPAGAEHADAAWDFIEWTLSEDVQVGIVAQDGGLVARIDLIENEYSREDPAVQVSNALLEVARTPSSPANNQLFNDPNGPFLTAFRDAIFGGDVDGALSEAQARATRIFQAEQ